MGCGLICTVPACKGEPNMGYHCEISEVADEQMCWNRATHHKPFDEHEDTYVCSSHKED